MIIYIFKVGENKFKFINFKLLDILNRIFINIKKIIYLYIFIYFDKFNIFIILFIL